MFKIESSEKEFHELMEKREKEIKTQVDTKIRKFKLGYVSIELALGILGLGIILYTSGWLLALGILCVGTANNMMNNRKFW